MIDTIKKLHELQLMAMNNERISVSVNVHNTGNSAPFWSIHVHRWFEYDVLESMYVSSTNQFAEHRIDMLLKYRVLEK